MVSNSKHYQDFFWRVKVSDSGLAAVLCLICGITRRRRTRVLDQSLTNPGRESIDLIFGLDETFRHPVLPEAQEAFAEFLVSGRRSLHEARNR